MEDGTVHNVQSLSQYDLFCTHCTHVYYIIMQDTVVKFTVDPHSLKIVPQSTPPHSTSPQSIPHQSFSDLFKRKCVSGFVEGANNMKTHHFISGADLFETYDAAKQFLNKLQ